MDKVDSKKLTKELETKKETKNDAIASIVNNMEKQIKAALPTYCDEKRFARIVLTTLRMNPELTECSIESLMGSILTAAEVGLEPGILSECYFVPFKNKKTGQPECQFMFGYKGLIKLMTNNTNIAFVDPQIVYENDIYEEQLGTNKFIKHIPCPDENRGKMIKAYTVIHYTNGMNDFRSITKKEIEELKNHSQNTGEFSIWEKNKKAMWLKSSIKQTSKYLPLETSLKEKIANDGAIKRGLRNNMSQIDPKDSIDVNYQEVG